MSTIESAGQIVLAYVTPGTILSVLMWWRSRAAVARLGKVSFVGVALLWPVVVAILILMLWDERVWARKVERGKWW